MEHIKYSDVIEKNLIEFCSASRGLIDYDFKYNEDECRYDYALFFDTFEVNITYGDTIMEGYSFIEYENISKTLLTEFKFPFTDIPFSIYDIHNIVGDNDFRTYNFHCLYDEELVSNAINTVTSFISRNIEKIRSINSNNEYKEKLLCNFEHDLKIASKKITLEKIKENPEKCLSDHSVNLYFLRYDKTVFTNFVLTGEKRDLEKFFLKKSNKKKLLVFEERYYQYLMEHDFSVADTELPDKAKIHSKKSSRISRMENALFVAGVILSLALNTGIYFISRNSGFFDDYKIIYSLSGSSVLSWIVFLISILAAGYIVSRPIEALFAKSDKYKNLIEKTDKKIYIIFLISAILILTGCLTYEYFDARKVIALGENDVYISEKVISSKRISYNKDEIKFYFVEGYYNEDENKYYTDEEDHMIVIVLDNDYENYYICDSYESGDYTVNEVLNIINKHSNISGNFKTEEDFCKEFDIEY